MRVIEGNSWGATLWIWVRDDDTGTNGGGMGFQATPTQCPYGDLKSLPVDPASCNEIAPVSAM